MLHLIIYGFISIKSIYLQVERNCEGIECDLKCEKGFQLDEKGCFTCQCSTKTQTTPKVTPKPTPGPTVKVSTRRASEMSTRPPEDTSPKPNPKVFTEPTPIASPRTTPNPTPEVTTKQSVEVSPKPAPTVIPESK